MCVVSVNTGWNEESSIILGHQPIPIYSRAIITDYDFNYMSTVHHLYPTSPSPASHCSTDLLSIFQFASSTPGLAFTFHSRDRSIPSGSYKAPRTQTVPTISPTAKVRKTSYGLVQLGRVLCFIPASAGTRNYSSSSR